MSCNPACEASKAYMRSTHRSQEEYLMEPNHRNSMRVVEKSGVSPAPGGSPLHPSSLPLTFFDVLWLSLSPVERVFLYSFPHPTSHFLESYLPNLKSSLSLTLQHFYPLAGKVRLSPNSTEQYELHYAEGVDSVSFTVSESDHDFLDLAASHPREFAKFQSLIPRLSEHELLAVQVTLFPNYGIAIGFALHHVACDGHNSIHFINSWASSCRSNGRVPLIEPSPSFDRSAIIDPCDLYAEYLRDAEILFKNFDIVTPPVPTNDFFTATFALGPNQIQGLKNLLGNNRQSTFVVSCAYVWVCSVISRRAPADEKAYFVFAVDWRKRLQPPPPEGYFGNCVGACIAEADVSGLVKEDGVVVAAEAIAGAIEKLKEGVLENMAGFFKKLVAVLPYRPLSIAGSPRFKVYGTDFGWGRPVKVEVPSIQENGAMSLSESRDGGGGGGGVEIGFVLPKHEMEALIVQFDSGLKRLGIAN